MRVVAIVAAVGIGGLACGSPMPPSEDGGVDASGETDGVAPDSSRVLPDAAADSSADAVVEDATADASFADASACPTPCMASSECETAYCDPEAMTCVEEPMPDGTPCGEMSTNICVAGTCVVPRCGDGYREPASSPRREGCDDGNNLDGDACSSTCEPIVSILASDPTGTGEYDQWPAEQGVAVAADGRGELLVVWAHTHIGSDGIDVFARRYTRGGVALPLSEDPLLLDDGNFQDPAPQVAGLATGGWVVAWADDRGTTTSSEASYRIVAADGTVGPLRTANQYLEGPQNQLRVVALDDGFVIAWRNQIRTPDEPGAGVMARVFRESGAPLGDEFAVATDRTNDQSQPYLASDGDEWVVIWTHSALVPGYVAHIYGRRYRGATAVDATPFYITPMMDGARGAVTSLGSGDYAVAWAQAGDVYARIIRAGDPTPDATMVLTAAATAGFETWPSVASMGGDDFLVVYDADGFYDFATSPGASLPAEAMDVRAALNVPNVSRASVSRTPDGLWFVWAGYAPGFTPDVLQAHFLALD